MRSTCGRVMSRKASQAEKPSVRAASACPWSAADSAERSSSATWADTFMAKVITATVTGFRPARAKMP